MWYNNKIPTTTIKYWSIYNIYKTMYYLFYLLAIQNIIQYLEISQKIQKNR